MSRRLALAAAIVAALAAAGLLATASAQTTWVVDAVDPPDAPTNAWDPGTIEAQPGDTVSFEFDQARTIHNLYLRLPDGSDVHLSASPVCDGPLGICMPPPDHPDPITHTVEDEGEYVYYCTIHGGDPSGNGMAGRVVVGDPDGGEDPAPMPNPSGEPEKLEDCPGPGARCGACLTGGCAPAGR